MLDMARLSLQMAICYFCSGHSSPQAMKLSTIARVAFSYLLAERKVPQLDCMAQYVWYNSHKAMLHYTSHASSCIARSRCGFSCGRLAALCLGWYPSVMSPKWRCRSLKGW